MHKSIRPHVPIFRKSIPALASPMLAALVAISTLSGAQFLLANQAPSARTPSTQPASVPPHKAVRPHGRRASAHSATQSVQAKPAPVTPPPPEPPKWPANDKPTPASVTWDSHGLRIDATNASLKQILNDVTTATGTTVEGLGTDERVFGAYGPGLAHDVISQLLQGSSYNVIMIGDQGQGAPREIVLSSRHPGDKLPAATSSRANGSDEDSDVEEQPAPGFVPGSPIRTPQQIMQEMQQRQQQQQQQQQQRFPPQPPPPQPPPPQ